MKKKHRNLARYREIAGLLIAHGFDYIAGELGIKKPFFWRRWRRREEEVKSFPQRLRLLFEDLGPTFIKLGQLLSTRPDLVPREYIKELARLQDRVEELFPAEVRQQFLQEFGRPPEEIFASFDYKPVASASIGQVHRAVLPDGTRVAVKVQRPGLAELVEKDLAFLEDVAPLLKERTVIGQVCDVEEIVEIFARHIRRELDYQVEAVHTDTFFHLFAGDSSIVVPRVYWDYTTSRILTLDFVEGVRVEKAAGLYFRPDNRRTYATNFYRALFKPLFAEGIFHGDPHPGNVLFQPGGKVVLIDFGVVGRFDPLVRQQIGRLILCLAEKDVPGIAELILKTGRPTGKIKEQHFFEDVAEMVDKAYRFNTGNISLGEIINEMVEISLRHGIKVPDSFFILGRMVMSGESIGRLIDPGINLLEVLRPIALRYMVESFNPARVIKDATGRAYNWLENLVALPEDLAQVVKNLARGEMRIIFYHRNLNWLYDMLDLAAARLSFALVAAAMMIGSALIMLTDRGPLLFGFPLLGIVGFVFSSAMGVAILLQLLRTYLR